MGFNMSYEFNFLPFQILGLNLLRAISFKESCVFKMGE